MVKMMEPIVGGSGGDNERLSAMGTRFRLRWEVKALELK